MAVMNQGRIVMQAIPSSATDALKGKVWTKQINKQEELSMNERHKVLSTGYNEDHSLTIRVFAASPPDNSFEAGKPNLEDVYFTALEGLNRGNH